MRLRDLITEAGGEAAGSIEIHSVNTSKVRIASRSLDLDPDKAFGDLDTNLSLAKRLAAAGHTKRHDMPVIGSKDMHQFQDRLKSGYIDIRKPFAPTTQDSNPFPTGLSGEDAKDFLARGLKDKAQHDDIITVTRESVPVGKLKPIQSQIYVDKALDIVKNKNTSLPGYLAGQSYFVTSADGYIIDGHHRWLAGVLVDPSMKAQVLVVNLPLNKLLPMSVAYSDAIGNKRNA